MSGKYERVPAPIGSIKPNPFRDRKILPLDMGKIEELKESIGKLGFWENLIARKAGKNYQLAFGHHRLEALKQLGHKEVIIQIPVEEGISDEEMFDHMVRENKSAYSERRSLAEQHDIYQLLKLVAKGTVKLSSKKRRYWKLGDILKGLPSSAGGEAFSASSVAEKMGWGEGKSAANRADIVLRQLKLIRDGRASEVDFANIGPGFAKEIISVVHQIDDVKTARRVGKELSDRAKDGKLMFRAVRKEGAMIAEAYGRSLAKRNCDLSRKSRDIDDAMRHMARELIKAMPLAGEQRAKLAELIKHQKSAKESRRWELKIALRRIAERCTRFADKIDAPDMTLSEASRELYENDQQDVSIRGFLQRKR